MMRCVLPSLRSPFTTNSSPPCSTSFRGKELDFGSARLSLLTIGFDESETLRKDTLRPHAGSSSVPLTVENDYSNLETTISKRSCKDLISDTEVLSDRDVSVYVRSVQSCSASHFHTLMANINLLENKVSDSELLKLEKDILVQLGRLGALQLFHACLSRIIDMSDLPGLITEDGKANVRKDNELKKKLVFSKRKEERKLRQERRLQASTSKRCACKSESSIESSIHHVVSTAAKKTKARGRRAIIAKNEAEMSRGIKVVAQLEKVKLTLEKETGKAVSLNCWAEAAGIDEKVLQHDLHFGWYCRDELLKSGRSLVLYLSRYYRGLGVAHEDLMQAGNIGILQGAERFDHTRGYQFSTYVQYWIRKAMSQLVSRHGRGIKVPTTLSTTINRVQKARKILKRSQGKHPDDVEVSKSTGLSLDKIKSADNCLRIVGSLDQKVGHFINMKYLECTPDTALEMPEKTVMKQHMRNDVHKLLQELDPKERRVLIHRYGLEGHCMSLHEVGKVFDVSKEWIRKMEKRALTKLRTEQNQTNLKHYLNL
ncbi:hypothetical protein SOVF_059470 [Spinacia oleracea]|nr:hypothetical protein SOVF_059470 [Spinacia oleracea]